MHRTRLLRSGVLSVGVGLLLLAGERSERAAAQPPAKTVVLDGNSAGRRFDGIGALSAGASSRLLIDYPEPYRSQILDYLFKPNFGAALQHLKVEIGGDVNSTDGSEPSHMRSPDDHDYTRGYEWWLMEEARKRNPQIILDTLPWGAPGWVGRGTLYTPQMADYVVDFLRGAQRIHGLSIAYTGVWNEKQYDAAYVKGLSKALKRGAPDVKLVCCDEYPGEGKGQWSIVDAMSGDPELKQAVDVVGVHYPQEHGKLTTPESAVRSEKPLWSSEDQPNPGSGPIVSRDWAVGGRILAQLYNRNYLEGAMTKTEIWSPITSYYDILAAPNSGLMYANTPWSGHYDVQSTIWVTAHTTQFTQPGWRYLDSSSGKLSEKGSYVTLRSDPGADWSSIVETIGASAPQTVHFLTRNHLSTAQVHVWETNSNKSFVHVADLAPKDGAFTYTFDPDAIYSLTTTVGQGRGHVDPPPQAPFPLPYHEDFEKTQINRAPKYLSDQNGAFEAHPCEGRKGHCLEQVIVNKPVPWGPMPDPFTLAGDVRQKNYRIAVDALMLDAGPVTIMGRIDSADVFQDGEALVPSGYVLRLRADGHWDLISARYKKPTATLAEGTIGADAKQWHHLELSFENETISASIDGKAVASVQDGTHQQGMFAVGSSWQRAQFDELTVSPR